MKNVLQVEGDEITIDPALVKVSSGDLPMAENVAVRKTSPGEITFTWSPVRINSEYGKDQVVMVAYNLEGSRVFSMLQGQFRAAGQDVLQIDPGIKASTVLHLYMAFIAADRSRQSDSLYVGEIII